MGGPVVPLAAAASALGGLVFGYELGIVSGALLQLRRELGLSCGQQEALVSALLLGALLASAVGGWLIDRHGRRNAILLGNGLVLGGSAALLGGSYPALLAGRGTVGFAVCLSSMSCCIYVSETVASERRGVLVTLYEAGVTVGVLAAYAVNYLLSESAGGWRWMFGMAVVPAGLQLVPIWFLPSSPSSAQNPQSQRELLSAVEPEEPDDWSVCSSSRTGRVGLGVLRLCQSRDNMRTRTVLGLGLVLFQQFTGQPNILFYASTVFRSVGFRSDASAVLASVGLGSVKVAATLTAMLFSDRVGRRPLLIGGCSVMAVCLLALGLLGGRSPADVPAPCGALGGNDTRSAVGNLTGPGSVLDQGQTPLRSGSQDVQQGPWDGSGESPPDWTVLLCMMAAVSAFAVGFGPMTWLLLSEIFPAEVRGRAFAFTNCFNWAAHLLVTSTFLNAMDAIGLSGVFLVYGLTATAATLFFYFLLPETRGKSLESIDQELRLNRFHHSRKCWSLCGDENSSPQYQRVSYRVSTTQ
ncbi:solute carrier family 2, facilitated glucose transporter member 10 [Salarias fasciatus]|uniref:solute carrier family 2, facilitated glucose transporter member 10 n=1 Tax=Salarias fasciatus TaxID=181472 RepID=UPI001176D95F|nr:solute carrier family 2, facilitated glucose transporter member 10 [Salarias fasciatus]